MSNNHNQSKNNHNTQRASISMPSNESNAPPASITQTPPPAIELTAQAPQKMKKVKIRKTVARLRYGSQWLQFRQGEEVMVEVPLAEHLDRKGII